MKKKKKIKSQGINLGDSKEEHKMKQEAHVPQMPGLEKAFWNGFEKVCFKKAKDF